jgi:hypothetical protein
MNTITAYITLWRLRRMFPDDLIGVERKVDLQQHARSQTERTVTFAVWVSSLEKWYHKLPTARAVFKAIRADQASRKKLDETPKKKGGRK